MGVYKGALRVSPKVSVGLAQIETGICHSDDGEVSLGPLGRTSSYAQCDQGVDHGMMCYGTSKVTFR